MDTPTNNVIDVHTHAFPDSLAERAIASLEAECPWKAVGSGKVSALVAAMDAAGVDVSVVCPIATKADQVEGILRWCRSIRSDRIEPFASIHPDTPEPGAWVDRIAAEGFKGLKLHPMYQAFAVDEPRCDGLYDACQQAGLIVAFHCGQDIAYPPEDDRAAPARFAALLKRYPRLRVICTHMGGWRAWDDVERHTLGLPNVYLETSFSLDALDPARAADMMRRHGLDRVLFGTDWPWQSAKDGLALLENLPLTPQEKHAIRWDNSAALLDRA